MASANWKWNNQLPDERREIKYQSLPHSGLFQSQVLKAVVSLVALLVFQLEVYELEIMVLVTIFGKQDKLPTVEAFICCYRVQMCVISLSRIFFVGLRLIFRVAETCKESFLQDFRHMAIEDFDDLFPFTTGLQRMERTLHFLRTFVLQR